jgi:DNA-binding NtrC family response regulator
MAKILMSDYSNTGRVRTAKHAFNVLVVDDEPMMRKMLFIILSEWGCKVLSAEDGEEALALATDAACPEIDILITDLCMPGMTGVELAAELRAVRPGLKTIFVSGFSSEEIAAMEIDLSDAAFVSKPFQLHTIDEAIRGLFECEAVSP